MKALCLSVLSLGQHYIYIKPFMCVLDKDKNNKKEMHNLLYGRIGLDEKEERGERLSKK
jgi:hypothetical protein